MKIKIITILFIATYFVSFAQKNTDELFRVDGTKVSVLEFKKVYEKNLNIVQDENQKKIKENLDLFINFKLKLKEAYRLKLNETKRYKREIETYKNQLISPYLQDTTYLSTLVKDAYYRTKYKVNVSHVLVKVDRNATPADTLIAYNKIQKARKEVLSGKDFDKVALAYSDDQSVKNNLGNVGYFTAFRMVYPFENNAYKTKIGEISEPFKTSYGYHFLKVNDLQLSDGEVEVAHLLITDQSKKGKILVDSIYTSLKNGANFEQLVLKYSKDKSTVLSEGKLPKFGIGTMVKPFEVASFKLKNTNDISMPFKTQYGWHIVKLLKKYPVKSFKKMKNELTKKVKASGGARMSDLHVLQRLKSEYKIVEFEKTKAVFNSEGIRASNKDTLQQVILSINNKKIKQAAFFDYIRNRRHKSIAVLFNDFKNEEVLTYFKEHLKFTEPEFANTLQEYQDGLIVFDFMQQKVWDKSTKDSVGLKNYFYKNKSKYSFKELSNNKGQVMNDYQEFLDKELIATLRKRYPVIIKKRTLKKLIKQYASHE
ncbi:Chaperone SurA [Polaribacter huanghezhanensis]|uniref:peptidylprolyl isomerase n=1 Tax=Polaribacter huanghezhanensis TaxID=1354726 RepID=UPI0026488B9A|nr:peptidylprolyl isomerase [Polaribacter huanghezhanensis]WKD86796.1 Chaperone SurA [Polaribacter huanghezhanensis]